MDAILLLLLYIVYVWFFPGEKVRRVQCAAVNEGRQVVCVQLPLPTLFFYIKLNLFTSILLFGGRAADDDLMRGARAIIINCVQSLTLGMVSLLQTPSERRRSRISQAKIDGHSRL